MNSFKKDEDPQFPSTHWSSVRGAGETEGEQGTAALGKLLERYQGPLKAYIVEKFRRDEHKAQDLFQGFVLEVVLKKRLIALACQAKGHQFRALLLRALSNFVTSEFRREQTQKRLPWGGLSALEELGIEEMEFMAGAEAESRSFDVNWAREVLSQALQRMQDYCRESGQVAIWEIFDQRLRRPILEGVEPTPYQQLVADLGFASPIQAQNALVTAKRVFARALRSVVAEYAKDEAAIEVEVREIQLILANARQS